MRPIAYFHGGKFRDNFIAGQWLPAADMPHNILFLWLSKGAYLPSALQVKTGRQACCNPLLPQRIRYLTNCLVAERKG